MFACQRNYHVRKESELKYSLESEKQHTMPVGHVETRVGRNQPDRTSNPRLRHPTPEHLIGGVQ